jgi:hypothetical protein
MPISFHHRAELLGDAWETAKGFLVSELDSLFAGLGQLGPLVDQPQNNPLTLVQVSSAGAVTLGSTLPAPLQFADALVLSPPPVGGTINDYTATGLAGAAVVRFAPLGGGAVLTGMVAPTGGSPFRLLVNTSTTDQVTLSYLNASSAPNNRFRNSQGAAFILFRSAAVWIWYDRASLVWQVIAP